MNGIKALIVRFKNMRTPDSYLNLYSMIFLLAVASCHTSCSKQAEPEDLRAYNWKVYSLSNENALSATKAESSYYLEFDSDSTFVLYLDVNSCWGKYSLTNSDSIKATTDGCTKVCCDSEFAENYAILISKMSTYRFSGRKLILEGKGQIVFFRTNDPIK